MLNLWAVGKPGRLDGEAAARLKEEAQKGAGKLPPPQILLGRSKFTPSGYAFAIWGPIFLGEMLFHLGGQFLLPLLNNDALMGAFANAAPSWVAGCLLQSLWCVTFRPRFRDAGALYLMVPAACLAGTAASLGSYHLKLRRSMLCDGLGGNWALVAALLPHAMHFGWLMAATLVNVNGSLAYMQRVISGNGMTTAAVASAGVATAIYGGIALERRAPAVALVGTWALTAIAYDMAQRESGDRPGYADDTVRYVKGACRVGAVLCAGMALLAWLPDSVLERAAIELPRLAC